jgi:hypothetical protein
MPGALTLSAIASLATHLDVACSCCERRGRLSIARLIRDHGAAAGLPSLRRAIAADCRKMIVDKFHDLCGVHFPGLSALTAGSARPAD